MTNTQRTKSKFICAILAVIVVWVGMYFQMQEVDSLFLCRPNGYKTAAMYRAQGQGNDIILHRAEEVTVIRDAIVRFQSVRRVLPGRGERLSVHMLIAPFMAMLLAVYLFAIAVHAGRMNASSTVILRFIHNKDGEK